MSIVMPIPYERFIEYCEARYRRIYRVTLVFDEYNLRRAYRVYRHGILKRRGVVEAITDIYGYRHRRMENFLKEIGIWVPRKGWALPHVLTKVTVTYTAKKRNTSNIILEADVVSPFPFIEYLCNEPAVLELVIECLEANGVYGIDEIIGDARIDSQFIPQYTAFLREETVDATVGCAIQFRRRERKYAYDYECVFPVKPFILGGVLVD